MSEKVYLSPVMIISNLSELVSSVEKGKCLLGVDYGSKVIGLAVSDPGLVVASPLSSIERKKFQHDAQRFMTIMRDRNIGGLVIGLPKNMDGTEGPTAQAARAFARNLSRTEGWPQELPVTFWDERLTTAAVERMMISDDMSRKRRDETIDKAAAAYMLQGALDAARHAQNSHPTH